MTPHAMQRFQLMLTWKHEGYRYESGAMLDCYEDFLRPLTRVAESIAVYDTSKSDALFEEHKSILRREKGKCVFDLESEIIRGHERLWGANGGRRGSILVIADPTRIDFEELFKRSHSPDVGDNPNAGDSPGAVRAARLLTKKGKVAFLFPRNNGMQYVTVCAAQALSNALFATATRSCTQVDMQAWKKSWFGEGDDR
ncbi:MAG: hypothetical protein IPK60_17570 [Sandaracinaceae bacterium]|nr:hypothetical protein [Sandaracinaceae bacterium]